MKNLHLIQTPSEDYFYNVINDVNLEVIDRYIFFEMQVANENDFDETKLDIPHLKPIEIVEAFNRLVENGYLKRIFDSNNNTHYYTTPTGDLNDEDEYAFN